MSLMSGKLELLMFFTFSHGGERNKQGGCVTDVASGPFKCHFGALMWLHGTLKKSSWT